MFGNMSSHLPHFSASLFPCPWSFNVQRCWPVLPSLTACLPTFMYFTCPPCCQVSLRIPCQFERKNSAKYRKKFCKVILVFFKGFKIKIFYNKTKFTTKILEKIKIGRKCIPVPFLPLWPKLGGPIGHQTSSTKRHFLRHFLSYFAEVLATVPARLTDIIWVVHQTRAIPPQIFSNRNVLE